MQVPANPGGRADGNRKQRGSRSLTAINGYAAEGIEYVYH
jgi:hypothetical protein